MSAPATPGMNAEISAMTADQPGEFRIRVRFSLILIALTLLVYAGKFQNQFVWDDMLFVTGPESKQELSLDAVIGFFNEPTQNLYRPLRSLLYAVAYQAGKDQPFAYHLVGFSLHLACVLLFFRLAELLFRSSSKALLAAMLFAVHPLKTDRATPITGSFDLLGIVFYLAAVILLIRFLTEEKRHKLSAAGMILCFVLGLFASEELISFPLTATAAAILLPGRRRVFEKVILVAAGFGVMVGFMAIRYAAIGTVSRGVATFHPYPWVAFYTFVGYFALYLQRFILPIQLSYTYDDLALSPSPWNAYTMVGFLVAGISVAAIVLLRKKNPALSFGLAFGGIALAPYTNLMPIPCLFAERYFYLASAGFTLVMAAILFAVPIKGRAKVALILVIIGILATMTVARNQVWRDQETLFGDAVVKRPHSMAAKNNLADVLSQKGQELFQSDPVRAEQYYQRSLAVMPTPKAQTGLALLLLNNGNAEQAEEHFREALNLSRYYTSALKNYAALLIQQKRWADARDVLHRCLNNPFIHNHCRIQLGYVCKNEGKSTDQCEAENDGDSRNWVLLGYAFAAEALNEPETSLTLYRQIAETAPDSEQAGIALRKITLLEEKQ